MLSNLKRFALYAGERALKTLAQTALALIIAANGLMEVSWVTVANVAGLAMLVSILTSIVSVTGDSLSPAAPAPSDPAPVVGVDQVSAAVNPANEVPAS